MIHVLFCWPYVNGVPFPSEAGWKSFFFQLATNNLRLVIRTVSLAAMSLYQIVVNNSTGSLIDSWGVSSSPINSKILAYLTAATLFGVVFYSLPKTKSNVPLINPRHLFEFTDNRAKQYFIKNSKSMIENQFAKTPDKPFRVISDTGVATVLPPCLANEIRNDPRLNFGGFTKKVKDTQRVQESLLTQRPRLRPVIFPASRDSATHFMTTL